MRTLNQVMASLEPERRQNIEQQVAHTLMALELAELRKQQGLSQQALANKIGVSQSAISQIENAHQHIQLDTLQKYINGLGKQLKLVIV